MPPTKPYTKTALNTAALVAHMQGKGLQITDAQELADVLERLGYYRLLVYMRPFQDHAKRFGAGVSVKDVLELYEFDRQLRLLCMDAIERIEVRLRAAIVNKIAVKYGPHFYLGRAHFREEKGWKNFLEKAKKARYLGISHYQNTYSSPADPPIWSILEAVTLGTLSHFFADLNLSNRKLIASEFGFDERILVSWFRTITVLRNMCAHHNRLWNFSFVAYQPILTKMHLPLFSAATTFHTRSVILILLLTSIGAAGNEWRDRLVALLKTTTGREQKMGFPAGWDKQPFWVSP